MSAEFGWWHIPVSLGVAAAGAGLIAWMWRRNHA